MFHHIPNWFPSWSHRLWTFWNWMQNSCVYTLFFFFFFLEGPQLSWIWKPQPWGFSCQDAFSCCTVSRVGSTESWCLLLLLLFLVTKSCLTLQPDRLQHIRLPCPHHLPEFAQTHIHWVGDAIQPSYPLSPPSPFALNLSQHQGLFQWVISSHQVAKVLELQLQHQFFQWIFRVDFL